MATLALDTLYNFADYPAAKIRVSTLAGDSTTRINLVFKYPTDEYPTPIGGNLTGGGSGGATGPTQNPDFTLGIQANGAGELVIQWSKTDNKIRGSRNSVEGAPVDIPWLTVTGVEFQFTSNNTAAVVTALEAQIITFELPEEYVEDPDSEEDPAPYIWRIVDLIEELELLEGTVVFTKSNPVILSGVNSSTYRTRTSSTSGLTTFTFSSSDTSAATITNGNILTYLDGTKTAVITASQSGNDHWLPATAAITLAPDTQKTPQTVTLTVVTPLSIGQQAAFTSSASSGLPVVVSSTNTDVVTISNGKLRAVAPGNVIIVAVQEGDDTYAEASVGKLVVVKKTAQTVTFPTDLSAAKVGDQLQLTASSSSGLPVTFSSSDNFVAAVSKDSVLFVRSQGAADITAFQAGSDIYDAAEVTKTLTIGASDQTITFTEMAPRAFDSPAFALGAFASSNLPLTYNSSDPLVATVSSEGSVFIHKVGTTFITVNQAGNTFWTPAASVQRLFTVTKAKQTISFSNVPSQINISEKVLLKGTSSSGEVVTFFVSGATLKLTEESGNFYITGTAEGQGTVTATAAGNSNYEAISVDFDVAVGRQSQQIVFPLIEPRTFNFRSFSLTASATSGLPVSFSSSAPAVASVSASGVVTVNKAGVTTITASQAGDAEWNAATSLQRFLVIDKGDQQISFSPPAPVPSTTASIVLSASAPGGAVVFKSSNSQVVEINGSVAVIRGVGAARIVATQAGSGDYMPAVAVVPIFVVPVIDSVATPSNSITDQEPHASTAVSPSTSAVAVVMGAPSTLDREEHNSLSISPALNLGDVVPPNTVLDQSAFSSREVSTIFTGTSQTLSGGSDHESYLAGVSSAFLGTPVTIGAVIEEDLSSYASFVASVADHAASECVRAKYDGRDSFEVYLASLPSAPEGYLLIRGGAYLLWGRTSEDGVFTGRIMI
jgi:hypothetical protein